MAIPDTMTMSITLRDWRAMNALTGLLATEAESLIGGTRTVAQLCTLAYQLADGLQAASEGTFDQSNWDEAAFS